MTVRSGLEGPVRENEGKIATPSLQYPRVTGKGPPQETTAGTSLEFGDNGRDRPRRIQPGSPEHHLLVEAKVLKGGSHGQENPEEGKEVDSKLRRRKESDPAGPRKRDKGSPDPGNSWPKSGGI